MTVHALGAQRLGLAAHRTAVAVRVRRVIHARHQRAEALPLQRLARRQRQRPHRPAVERAEERDDVVALRVPLRELDAGLDGLGAGVAEERPLVSAGIGRDRRHLLGEAHLRLVVEVGARHVQEALRLVDDRLHDLGMRVPGRVDGDAGGAVEEAVAVHVLDDGALSAGHDERDSRACRTATRTRSSRVDERRGLRTGQRCLDDRGRCIVDCPAWLVTEPLTSASSACRAAVLEQDAARGEVVADPVGGGEVAAAARRLPRLDQPLDLGGLVRAAARLRPGAG